MFKPLQIRFAGGQLVLDQQQIRIGIFQQTVPIDLDDAIRLSNSANLLFARSRKSGLTQRAELGHLKTDFAV